MLASAAHACTRLDAAHARAVGSAAPCGQRHDATAQADAISIERALHLDVLIDGGERRCTQRRRARLAWLAQGI